MMTCRSDGLEMTVKRHERIMLRLRTIQQLARREKASNRIQNNIDKIILEMKRIERNRRKK